MKNKYDQYEDYIIIYIVYNNKQYECYIDKEDFEKVNSFNTTWFLNVSKSGHIDGVKTKIQINGVRKQYWMHNVVKSKNNEDNIIDHIDHNTLNNRKNNLREISKKENASNIIVVKNNNSGYRNIYVNKNGTYRVRINNKSFGNYSDINEAIKVAELERKKLFPLSNNINNKTLII